MATRRVTLADVAKAAGCSPTTASLVLSGRARELRISRDVEDRVVKAAESLQYRRNIVSLGLRTGSTKTIGLISDNVATTQVASDMIKGALDAARQEGLTLFFAESEGEPDAERDLLQAMLDRGFDGIVMAAMFTRTMPVPDLLQHTAAVLLNALPREPTSIPSIIPAEYEAGCAAAELLLEAGHREDIYLLGAGPRLRDVPADTVAGVERLKGIRDTLSAAGAQISGGTICYEWHSDEGYYATKQLLESRPAPHALICFSDRVAFGAFQALSEAGLAVPRDVSIVSFDDQPVATWMRPQLSTIALPHYELGRAAVEELCRQIENRDAPASPPAVRRLPMEVKRRASVGPPRAVLPD